MRESAGRGAVRNKKQTWVETEEGTVDATSFVKAEMSHRATDIMVPHLSVIFLSCVSRKW